MLRDEIVGVEGDGRGSMTVASRTKTGQRATRSGEENERNLRHKPDILVIDVIILNILEPDLTSRSNQAQDRCSKWTVSDAPHEK